MIFPSDGAVSDKKFFRNGMTDEISTLYANERSRNFLF